MVNQSDIITPGWNWAAMRPALFAFLFASVAGLGGCDSFMGEMKGAVAPNRRPVVEFTNVPADSDMFSYAPVIHWKGRDPDGFVENYLYADITDPTAILDPDYYYDLIPKEAWVETKATSDTVYLLTEKGEITEHVFYVICIDDRGDTSSRDSLRYRTFFRSNEPPRVPLVKWWAHPDENYGNDIIIGDTLYCLDAITNIWSGLGFSWKSSDPDDRALYTIPLEYSYYLEKVPHDTIWEWVSDGWTSDQELMFYGLETGHYTFSVWARDDGLSTSERPATAILNVYKPTFENSLLLLDVTKVDENPRPRPGKIVPGTQVGELYSRLAGVLPDVEYFHYPNESEIQPWKSYLGRFKLVILISENPDGYGLDVEMPLVHYLGVGGRLWVSGYYLRRTRLISEGRRPDGLASVLYLARSEFVGPLGSYPPNKPDFIAALPHDIYEMPTLLIDTSVIADVYEGFYPTSRMPEPFLPGVDLIATGDPDVEVVYNYVSKTIMLDGNITNDWADVVEDDGEVGDIYYPPTPVDCIIKMPENKILAISRIENTTRGVVCDVLSWTNNAWRSGTSVYAIARVSYPYGEPWSLDDSIQVDYVYDPVSETHLRPCAIRYEHLEEKVPGEERYELSYRVAVFTFPLYFLDNSASSGNNVDLMFRNMLDWFFWPQAH